MYSPFNPQNDKDNPFSVQQSESINSYIIWNIAQKETIKNHLLDCIHSDRKCATRIPESSSKVYVNCN